MQPRRLPSLLERFRWTPRRRAWLVTAVVPLLSACFELDDGREPPLDRVYFPTGLALSPGGSRLYVANSNWDLQFNAGTVQVFDADRLRSELPRYCDADAECASGERCDLEGRLSEDGELIAPTHWCTPEGAADPCGERGVQSAAERLTVPGLCRPFEAFADGVLLDSVVIGAFATNIAYRSNPNGGGRLFVPVRSDATLHWLDVSGDPGGGGPEIDCGQDTSGECDDAHRRGGGFDEATREERQLPVEPFGLAVTEDGQAIVTTHQTQGSVGLFLNDWSDPGAGPRLAFLLEGLPTRVLAAAAVPVSRLAERDRELGSGRSLGYQPGFWLSYRGAAFLELVRYFDPVDSGGRPFLERAGQAALTPVGVSDVRDIAVDASNRRRCEASCGDDDTACLTRCASIGLDVFLANRAPSSLLAGHTVPNRTAAASGDDLVFNDLLPMGDGPSRAVVGRVLDEQGEPQRRVFIVSFDSNTIDVFDPVLGSREARIYTGRGPNALAIDEERGLGYVAHFTDSYIGVIDLDRRHRGTYGSVIFSLGRPVAPRGSE